MVVIRKILLLSLIVLTFSGCGRKLEEFVYGTCSEENYGKIKIDGSVKEKHILSQFGAPDEGDETIQGSSGLYLMGGAIYSQKHAGMYIPLYMVFARYDEFKNLRFAQFSYDNESVLVKKEILRTCQHRTNGMWGPSKWGVRQPDE